MEFKNKLDKLNFQSLEKLGIDWRKIVSTDPEISKEYEKYLEQKQQYIIINLDFSQLEFYVLASLSRDPIMLAMVNSGRDIHSENTKKLTGIDYLALEEQEKKCIKKYGLHGEETLNVLSMIKAFKAKRKTVKAFTFSLSYGAGAGKIAMDLGITEAEAQKLIDDFYNAYPGVKKWQNTSFKGAIENGYITTPFGRRRNMDRVKGRYDAYKAYCEADPKAISALKKAGEYWGLREEFKQTINSNIQSTATDMCSAAACKVKEWLKTAGKRAEMYFWVHDSIVLGCHIDDAIDVIEYVRDVMENKVKYPGDPVNYRAAMDIGFNYEWMVEVERNEWLSAANKRELLEKKLDESLDIDAAKKFKLTIKSTSLTLDDNYTSNVQKLKQEHFEKLVRRLNIPGVTSPKEYMCYMNSCSEEEYDESMGFNEDDIED